MAQQPQATAPAPAERPKISNAELDALLGEPGRGEQVSSDPDPESGRWRGTIGFAPAEGSIVRHETEEFFARAGRGRPARQRNTERVKHEKKLKEPRRKKRG